MKHLSKKQRDILSYIEQYHRDHGFPPTLREICKKFTIRSTNGARYHLHRLKELGYLEIVDGKSRGMRMVQQAEEKKPSNVIELPIKQNSRIYQLPILGRIPAGAFNYASEDLREDELTVDPQFFAGRTDNPELFGLRVKGDSMIEAGIFEGDVVVVRCQKEANNGDIVVAQWEDEATVKRYRREPNCVVLEPANSAYQSIYVNNQGGEDFGQHFSLLGVVVGLIRSM